MANLQVRDVPEDVHAALRARAATRGQSLSEYVLDVLRREARTPTIEELFERARTRPGSSAPTSAVVDHLRSDRAAG